MTDNKQDKNAQNNIEKDVVVAETAEQNTTENDVVETMNDITFIAESKLVDEFGGFKLLSSEENDGRGLSLKPVIEVAGGCGSCGGGCGH